MQLVVQTLRTGCPWVVPRSLRRWCPAAGIQTSEDIAMAAWTLCAANSWGQKPNVCCCLTNTGNLWKTGSSSPLCPAPQVPLVHPIVRSQEEASWKEKQTFKGGIVKLVWLCLCPWTNAGPPQQCKWDSGIPT